MVYVLEAVSSFFNNNFKLFCLFVSPSSVCCSAAVGYAVCAGLAVCVFYSVFSFFTVIASSPVYLLMVLSRTSF